MAKPALGRGLGALLGGAVQHTAAAPAPAPVPEPPRGNGEQVYRIAIHQIRPCPFQPRKDFSEDALRELADSIREQGVVQPLVVRRRNEHFELIAGERRWRAAQIAGLNELPVVVREADDRAVLELALIENLQRENLNPIEEALGFGQLIEQFQLTQEEAAKKVGKSRVAVANALRLLKLHTDVQAYVRDGRLSVGHAKVILSLPRSDEQKVAAERVIKDSLTVRQTEDLVARLQSSAAPAAATAASPRARPASDTHVADLQNKLQERFGTKVQVRYRQGKGSVEIKFFSDDDLERIIKIAGINLD